MLRGWKAPFVTANLFLGGMIGAGFATGQEVYHYFSRYGQNGMRGVVLVAVLVVLLCRRVLDVSSRCGYRGMPELLQGVCGKPMGRLCHKFFVVFLFAVFGIMGSSMGALLHQLWGISVWLGFALYVCLMWALLAKGEEGMEALFSVFTPLMTLGILCLCLYALATRDAAVFAQGAGTPTAQGAMLAALLYFGYNSILAVSLLADRASALDSAVQRRRAALLCGGILGLCLMVVCVALAAFRWEIAGLQIPMLYLAQLGGSRMLRLYSLVLFCAIVTTGAGCGYALIGGSCLHQQHTPGRMYRVSCLCLISCCFAWFDFSFLIDKCYGAFGAVGLGLCLCIMWPKKYKKPIDNPKKTQYNK